MTFRDWRDKIYSSLTPHSDNFPNIPIWFNLRMRGHLLFLLIFGVKTQVNYTEEIEGDIEDGELEDIAEIQN